MSSHLKFGSILAGIMGLYLGADVYMQKHPNLHYDGKIDGNHLTFGENFGHPYLTVRNPQNSAYTFDFDENLKVIGVEKKVKATTTQMPLNKQAQHNAYYFLDQVIGATDFAQKLENEIQRKTKFDNKYDEIMHERKIRKFTTHMMRQRNPFRFP